MLVGVSNIRVVQVVPEVLCVQRLQTLQQLPGVLGDHWGREGHYHPGGRGIKVYSGNSSTTCIATYMVAIGSKVSLKCILHTQQ